MTSLTRRRSTRRADRDERKSAVQPFWTRTTPHDMDVLDCGDHFKVTSCDKEVVGWWISTLRAAYPQDQLSTQGDRVIKMHPQAGVTLKLNRADGTLKVKGPLHLKWFKENFAQMLERDSQLQRGSPSEMAQLCDRYLRIDDHFTVSSFTPSTKSFLVALTRPLQLV